jgi:hypothetical protein
MATVQTAAKMCQVIACRGSFQPQFTTVKRLPQYNWDCMSLLAGEYSAYTGRIPETGRYSLQILQLTW